MILFRIWDANPPIIMLSNSAEYYNFVFYSVISSKRKAERVHGKAMTTST